jgi:hypothetical protein
MLADNSRGGESGEVLHLTIQNLILKIWGHLEHPFGSELRQCQQNLQDKSKH